MKIVDCIKRNGPTILSITAMVGVVGTAISAAWAAKKSEEKTGHHVTYESYWADNDEYAVPTVKHDELTFKQYIKRNWKYYIPAVGCAIVTCSCIGLSDHLNKKRQAALISACVAANNAYKTYREAVIEEFGEEKDLELRTKVIEKNGEQKDVIDLTSDHYEGEVLLFYEELSGRYFNATMEHVKDAEYHFNRNLQLRDYATLDEFYSFLGLGSMVFSEEIGWCTWAEPTYGYKWVDFAHDKVTLDDGLECYILSYPFEPHADFMEC